MTTKEVGTVEEAIKSEVLCLVKLQIFEQQAQDPELRHFVSQALATCRRHVDDLLNELR